MSDDSREHLKDQVAGASAELLRILRQEEGALDIDTFASLRDRVAQITDAALSSVTEQQLLDQHRRGVEIMRASIEQAEFEEWLPYEEARLKRRLNRLRQIREAAEKLRDRREGE